MSGRELVERFYHEVWNRRNGDAAKAILQEGFEFRGSLGPSKFGVSGFLDYVDSVHAALGNYQCIIEDLVEAPGRVAARMEFRGTHRASFFGVEATGREISWSGAAFFTLAGGKIAKLWVLGDIDAVRQQLGASASPPFEG